MPSIELVAVVPDQKYMEPTLKAIRKSVSMWNNFDNISVVCPPEICVDHEFADIEAEDLTYENYSEFMVKKLAGYAAIFDCDFVMTIQWDSCIINASKWTEEFLDYDYIGASWQNAFINRIGNGGFSLRSRKFLKESSKLDYIKTDNPIANNEDIVSCVINYEKMVAAGVKFAPLMLARQFSVERPIPEAPHNYEDISTYNSFGAHGSFNVDLMNFINK